MVSRPSRWIECRSRPNASSPFPRRRSSSDLYMEYNEMVANLAKNLMDIIIEGLEVNAKLFPPYLNNNSSLLQWNHYSPCPQPHKSLGMWGHTDFNLLTMLHDGDVGGLQLENDGKWIAVKP